MNVLLAVISFVAFGGCVRAMIDDPENFLYLIGAGINLANGIIAAGRAIRQ